MTNPATLPDDPLPEAGRLLSDANADIARRLPGESAARQPVHTVYGGGHLFRSDTASKLGAVALRALDEYGADPWTFAQAVGLPGAAALPADSADRAALLERRRRDPDALRRDVPAAWLALAVYERVREKLLREPVEDFRIDFEDGYGARPDAEEDAHVVAAAEQVARGAREGTLPPFLGIRIKPVNEEWRRRSIRTLDRFLTTLTRTNGGVMPPGFVTTLPKITHAQQVAYLGSVLAELERKLGLAAETLRFEIMVETPQSIIDPSGRCPLPEWIAAGQGRITAAHFGTYDYSASLGISAAYQRMRHEACQFALRTMQVALAGTGVWLSDGSTTVMPVPIHRAAEGASLSPAQDAANRDSVHHAWRLHYEDVRHSLVSGLYQGWDLHPAQLPTRFAALFAFFLEGLDGAASRLRSFLDHAAQATLLGDTFDDAATGQGLLNYFLRAINSGALSQQDVVARTGLTLDDLREKSFVRILRRRKSG